MGNANPEAQTWKREGLANEYVSGVAVLETVSPRETVFQRNAN
jgi:hypothetical protein